MGPAGLTAVFGMGTGVTPPVWSPEMCPAGGQAGPGTLFPRLGRTRSHTLQLMSGVRSTYVASKTLTGSHARWLAVPFTIASKGWQRPDRGGQAAWLLGPVG